MDTERSTNTNARPLTVAHIEQMEQGAAEALARRPAAYFTELAFDSSGIALTAVLSLSALWLWNAPPLPILIWLVAGAWIGICGEWLKYAMLGSLVRTEMATMAADQQVWFVADALRSNDEHLRRRTMKSCTPWRAMFFDLVAGIAATAVMFAAVSYAGANWALLLDLEPRLQLAIVAGLGLQIGSLVWSSARHYLGVKGVQADFAGGVRGAALILLTLLVLIFGVHDRDLRLALSVANGVLLLCFVFHAGGTLLEVRETRWLREHMRRKHQSSRVSTAS
jgi:hypothetical protein